jgi:hypothetical protein
MCKHAPDPLTPDSDEPADAEAWFLRNAAVDRPFTQAQTQTQTQTHTVHRQSSGTHRHTQADVC